MSLSSSFLLTKALLIVAAHTLGEHGPSEGEMHLVKHFSVGGEGQYCKELLIVITNSVVLRFSVLPAQSMDGIVHCDIVEGAFNLELFYQFINHILDKMQPFFSQNSVIIMDNCCIHKNLAILKLIESQYIPYYPCLIFTHIKSVECATSSCPHILQITIPSN